MFRVGIGERKREEEYGQFHLSSEKLISSLPLSLSLLPQGTEVNWKWERERERRLREIPRLQDWVGCGRGERGRQRVVPEMNVARSILRKGRGERGGEGGAAL